jgi:hypothetical protein
VRETVVWLGVALSLLVAAQDVRADETIDVTVHGTVNAPVDRIVGVFSDTARLPQWFGHCRAASKVDDVTRVVLDGPAPISRLELLSRVTVDCGAGGCRTVNMRPASLPGLRQQRGVPRVEGVRSSCVLKPQGASTRVSYHVSMPTAVLSTHARGIPGFIARPRLKSYLKDQASRSLRGLQRQVGRR